MAEQHDGAMTRELFDAIIHDADKQPFTCADCGQTKQRHEFYGNDGVTLELATFVTRNVASKERNQSLGAAWEKEVCNECFEAFCSRAWVTRERSGNTFFATCTF